MHIEEIGRTVVQSAIRVHSELGSGLLESAYQACLIFELRRIGLEVNSEVTLPVTYQGMKIDAVQKILLGV
ncbi:MAG TPA: GxxExxY protein [Desulfuromonadaceae bacterium]